MISASGSKTNLVIDHSRLCTPVRTFDREADCQCYLTNKVLAWHYCAFPLHSEGLKFEGKDSTT